MYDYRFRYARIKNRVGVKEMKIKVSIIICVVLSLLSITVSANSFMFSTEEVNDDLRISGGAIRIDPNGVYIIHDSAHHPVGIESVYVDEKSGVLVIVKDNNNPAVTTSADPDETLAKKGVTVGLSGGGRISNITFYKNGRKLYLNRAVDYKQASDKMANIWFTTVSHKQN